MIWPAILLLRVLITPCSWLVVFSNVAMSNTLVAMWLAYSPTWVVRFMLVPVMLVTAALPYSVAWSIVLIDSSVPLIWLAP